MSPAPKDAGAGLSSDLSASAPAFTPGAGSAVPYVKVSASAPPAEIDVEGTGSSSGATGDMLTSMLFGKDGQAPSSTVAAGGGSPEKGKDGNVMNFFEKVAVAVGIMSSDDEDEEASATATAAAASSTTTPAPAT